MTTTPNKAVTDTDRLTLTLFLAIVIHSIAILGLGFGLGSNEQPIQSMIDVILVQAGTNVEPEEADFIAQANQQGSGTEEEAQRPASDISGPLPVPQAGDAPMQLQAAATSTPQKLEDNFITQRLAEYALLNEEEFQPVEQNNPQQGKTIQEPELEVAALKAEVNADKQNLARRPRVNFFNSVSAKTAIEASYIKVWVEQIESFGNLNYPDEARRRKLSGSLILHATINHDGSLINTRIGSSSGQQLLDDAAVRITRYATPFAKFPDEMREEYDQIVITRTWVFNADQQLTTK